MWAVNFLMFKLVLEKAEEPEIKLPTSAGSSEKQQSSRKTSTSASLTTVKPPSMSIMTNCGKFWKRWDYQTTLTVSWETYMWVKKQQLKPNTHTQKTKHKTTVWFKIGKGVWQGCILSLCLFNLYAEYIMLGWMNHKVESRLLGEISATSDMQMISHSHGRKWRRTKEPLDKKIANQCVL